MTYSTDAFVYLHRNPEIVSAPCHGFEALSMIGLLTTRQQATFSYDYGWTHIS